MSARVSLICAALLGCVALAACGKHAAPHRKVQVTLVEAAPGSGYDTFNQQAGAGLAACNRDAGATLATVVPQSAEDYESQLTLAATENADLIVAIGFPEAPDVVKVARRFEVTHFALIGAVAGGPNVNSITFDDAQGSFLAGALAAMVSKTGSIAFLGGVDDPLLVGAETGFVAGARSVNPQIAVRTRYAGSFTDAAAAKREAASLFESGSDIVYVVAGPAGLGAVEAVKQRRGVFLIGADSDQDGLAPGKILTSVVKRVDVAARRACLETVAEKPAAGHTVLGLAQGGVGLTGFTYTKAAIGSANLARLERIRQALIAGTLEAPATRGALARFSPKPVR